MNRQNLTTTSWQVNEPIKKTWDEYKATYFSMNVCSRNVTYYIHHVFTFHQLFEAYFFCHILFLFYLLLIWTTAQQKSLNHEHQHNHRFVSPISTPTTCIVWNYTDLQLNSGRQDVCYAFEGAVMELPLHQRENRLSIFQKACSLLQASSCNSSLHSTVQTYSCDYTFLLSSLAPVSFYVCDFGCCLSCQLSDGVWGEGFGINHSRTFKRGKPYTKPSVIIKHKCCCVCSFCRVPV